MWAPRLMNICISTGFPGFYLVTWSLWKKSFVNSSRWYFIEPLGSKWFLCTFHLYFIHLQRKLNTKVAFTTGVLCVSRSNTLLKNRIVFFLSKSRNALPITKLCYYILKHAGIFDTYWTALRCEMVWYTWISPGKELERMVLIPTKSVALRKSSNF